MCGKHAQKDRQCCNRYGQQLKRPARLADAPAVTIIGHLRRLRRWAAPNATGNRVCIPGTLVSRNTALPKLAGQSQSVKRMHGERWPPIA